MTLSQTFDFFPLAYAQTETEIPFVDYFVVIFIALLGVGLLITLSVRQEQFSQINSLLRVIMILPSMIASFVASSLAFGYERITFSKSTEKVTTGNVTSVSETHTFLPLLPSSEGFSLFSMMFLMFGILMIIWCFHNVFVFVSELLSRIDKR